MLRSGQAVGDDFGHAEEGVVFNALGGADDDLAGVKMGARGGQGGAEEFRGNDGDDDLGVGDAALSFGDVISAGSGKPGRKSVFSPASLICRATSALCDQRMTGGHRGGGARGRGRFPMRRNPRTTMRLMRFCFLLSGTGLRSGILCRRSRRRMFW